MKSLVARIAKAITSHSDFVSKLDAAAVGRLTIGPVLGWARKFFDGSIHLSACQVWRSHAAGAKSHIA
jgi:hypothetical protein